MNKRKCAICKKPALYLKGLAAFCSAKCGTELSLQLLEKGRLKKEKASAKDHRAAKASLRDTVPIWTKKVQVIFNRYIRLRDSERPCVSCGKTEKQVNHSLRGGAWDCGHYRSVGSAPELRFEPLNAHKQCKKCNSFQSGNHVEYRFGISARLTKEQLAWLEGPHEPKRYRVPELKEIAEKFKLMIKELDCDT